MIGFVRGRLIAKTPPQLLIDVNGVGYEIEAPMSTFYALGAIGDEIRLLTHLVVREDAHVLYGFGAEDERRLFRNLIKVSGVGPKMALGILSGSSVEAFTLCVQSQDVKALTRIPGIGRKTAERLLIEMRDRLDTIAATSFLPEGVGSSGTEAEAFSALVALGYKPAEATRMLKVAGPADSTEDLIRRALQGAAQES